MTKLKLKKAQLKKQKRKPVIFSKNGLTVALSGNTQKLK